MAAAMLTISVFSNCTPGGGTTTPVTPVNDSVYNGSYLTVSYNGKTFHSRDVVAGNVHWNMLLTNSISSSVFPAPNNTVLQIALGGATGISGISSATLYFRGAGGTGNYIQNNMADVGYTSTVLQTNPSTMFFDTSGSATVNYNGNDYIEGTFSITMYTTAGLTYPATGSFKIYH